MAEHFRSYLNGRERPGFEPTFEVIGDPAAAAVSVAISHVSFNLIGTIIWYPLRRVPIGLARSFGRVAANSKRYALFFLLGVFFVIPIIAIVVTELILMIIGGGGP